MILFNHSKGPSGSDLQIVTLFGVGLVGGAIARELERRDNVSSMLHPLDWLSVERRTRELEMLSRPIHKSRNLHRLDVVWAAGKAGFGAAQDELDGEMRAFIDVVAWARSLRSTVPKGQLHFHTLSSGGGLFEGQRFIDRTSVAHPQRPYGRAKLAQEHLLEKAREDLQSHIYRPSSIYGFGGPRSRAGLVNTLIANARRHAVSRIFGDLVTVRDYVLSSDVGRFIARRIVSNDVAPGIFTLASGKSTSIKEILEIARKVIGRPLYIRLDSIPANAAHITYRASVLPADWHPTDLETGMRQVARQLCLSFDSGTRV